MATARLEQIVTEKVNLNLSKEEARFLLILTQNYHGEYPEDETESVRKMRESIFETIYKLGLDNDYRL